MMDYQQTLDFLYESTPMFQNVGAAAYKPGLDNTLAISRMMGDPHIGLKAIHVGGTNGKGSTAHTIAAILQSAGYKTGLFTSPHLVDFRERIRINGKKISKHEVVDFVARFIAANDSKIAPSFFELTTIMAFEHFRRHNVDVAVVEVGLGGRLDCTNIITPDLSVITNISLDHTALLGNTVEAIASEKAGIIKAGVPAVIGESSGRVRDVFATTAGDLGAPIDYADDMHFINRITPRKDSIEYATNDWGIVVGELCGDCQTKNAATIFASIARLQAAGYNIAARDVQAGFANVCRLTGLMGRWMTVDRSPLTICDTGHNVGGWQYLAPRLSGYGKRLHMIIGFVNDKDVSSILKMMPHDAHYHFVAASVKRALPANLLQDKAAEAGLTGDVYASVSDAYNNVRRYAAPDDVIYVGGSTFVVADLLSNFVAD